MVSRDERVNNEFYVAPVFNDICSDGGSVGYLTGSERNGVFGLGTPSDLEYFLTTSQSRATKPMRVISHRGLWHTLEQKIRSRLLRTPLVLSLVSKLFAI